MLFSCIQLKINLTVSMLHISCCWFETTLNFTYISRLICSHSFCSNATLSLPFPLVMVFHCHYWCSTSDYNSFLWLPQPIRRCGLSVGAAYTQLWPICVCSISADVAYLLVQPICRCGLSVGAAYPQVWPICGCSLSAGVAYLWVQPICRCGHVYNVGTHAWKWQKITYFFSFFSNLGTVVHLLYIQTCITTKSSKQSSLFVNCRQKIEKKKVKRKKMSIICVTLSWS